MFSRALRGERRQQSQDGKKRLKEPKSVPDRPETQKRQWHHSVVMTRASSKRTTTSRCAYDESVKSASKPSTKATETSHMKVSKSGETAYALTRWLKNPERHEQIAFWLRVESDTRIKKTRRDSGVALGDTSGAVGTK